MLLEKGSGLGSAVAVVAVVGATFTKIIIPTSENNKTRIGFDCKHVGCLFGLFFVKLAKNGESGNFVKKFVNYSQRAFKL